MTRIVFAFAVALAVTGCHSKFPPPTRVDKPAPENLYAGKCPLGLGELSKDAIFVDGKPYKDFAADPARKEALEGIEGFIPKYNERIASDYGDFIKPGSANLTLHVKRIDLLEDDKVHYPTMTYETIDASGTVVHGFMYEYPMSIGPTLTGGAMAIYLGEWLKQVCAK
jgi:hypothetical protein